MMIRFKQPNKRILTIAIVMIAVGLSGLGFGIYQANTSQAEIGNDAPNFTPVLPKNETIEHLGGWQKMTPPNSDPFFVYIDSLDGVSINVSQQRLPPKFRTNPSQSITELARAYNANTKLDVDDMTVYIGSSAKGPQSVIFMKNDLLITIKSWATIDNGAWVAYIQSLE